MPTTLTRPQPAKRKTDFETLFNALPSLCLVLAPDFTMIAASDAYLRATMTKRADIIGRNVFDVFPDNPDDPNATGVSNLRTSLAHVLKHKTPHTMAIQKYDIRKPAPNSDSFEERYWSPLNSPVFDTDGNVMYIIHRVEDVTEFMRLKKQQSAQSMPDGKTLAQHMDAEIYLRAQEIQKINQTIELERARLEQELRQAQKMEALGHLTGGMAHDFNNLLAIIIGNLDLMEGETTKAGEEFRQASINAVTRGAELISALLAFSRRQPLNPSNVDVNEHLEKLATLLRRVLGERIEVIVQAGARLWPVRIDSVQLESAVTNLAINSRDAMPRGGQLYIRTENVILDPDTAENPDVRPGPYVCIDITDTGTGMSKEILARVFEPFFTTKDTGKGTGLGLSMVYGFIKQSGGHIKIYSEVGHGTSIKLYVPALDGIIQRTEIEEELPTNTRASGETIFVVEDSASVRRTTIQQLHNLGYKTIEASNGKEALDIISAGTPFDLLFSDIIMPGTLTGFDVAREVRKKSPSIPILLTSGFSGSIAQEADAGIPLDAEILNKPYRKTDLARKLREILQRRA